MLTNIKAEYSDILYNPTHFPDPLGMSIRRHDLYGLKYHWVNKYENDMPHLSHKRIYSGTYLIRHTKGIGEMCWIVQDVRTCLIDIPRGSGKCVGLYRMSEYSAFMLVNIYTLGRTDFFATDLAYITVHGSS
jgi:hypothetical protein